jgi:hypothetical protein
MLDFAAARRMMVDGQVRTSDVTDPRIVAAMLELPRERFVPEGMAAMAYLDRDLPVTADRAARFLLKPMVLAKLIQAAEIGQGDHVLDVACAPAQPAIRARCWRGWRAPSLRSRAMLRSRSGRVQISPPPARTTCRS